MALTRSHIIRLKVNNLSRYAPMTLVRFYPWHPCMRAHPPEILSRPTSIDSHTRQPTPSSPRAHVATKPRPSQGKTPRSSLSNPPDPTIPSFQTGYQSVSAVGARRSCTHRTKQRKHGLCLTRIGVAGNGKIVPWVRDEFGGG